MREVDQHPSEREARKSGQELRFSACKTVVYGVYNFCNDRNVKQRKIESEAL
jgi:hypothetical protein